MDENKENLDIEEKKADKPEESEAKTQAEADTREETEKTASEQEAAPAETVKRATADAPAPAEPGTPSVKSPKKSNTSALVGGLLLIAVIGAAIFFGAVAGVPLVKYLEGKKAMADREYQEAIGIFSELGDYKDSQALITECRYDLGVIAFNEGDYDSARSTFEELGDIYDCQDLINRMDYDHAVDLFENGYIRRAIEELHELGDYEGADEMITYMTGIFREKDNFKYFAAVQPGDRVIYGCYEGTPLEWTILEVNEDEYQVRMICDTYIGEMAYDDRDPSFDDADVRQWLDTDFWSGAFSSEERMYMTYVHLDGATSRFYLLNSDEVGEYLSDVEDRCFEHDWWLRPSDSALDTIPYVTADGRVEAGGTDYTDELAVRPAILLSVARAYWN